MYTAAQIAAATGDDPALIALYWPQIVNGLRWAGINDHPTRLAAIATVATECDFRWLTELGTGQEYEGRGDLGNIQPGDGPRFLGRGYIQLTGRANYAAYGPRVGVDLIAHPELAADPSVAGRTLALYFRDHGFSALAAAGNWRQIRIITNGGLNGWERYITIVNNLLAQTEPSDAPAVTTLGVNASLKTHPDHQGPPANPVVADLAKGCTLTFDESPGHPYGIRGEWAKVRVLSGHTQKGHPATGLLGWLVRADLRTVGG